MLAGRVFWRCTRDVEWRPRAVSRRSGDLSFASCLFGRCGEKVTDPSATEALQGADPMRYGRSSLFISLPMAMGCFSAVWQALGVLPWGQAARWAAKQEEAGAHGLEPERGQVGAL